MSSRVLRVLLGLMTAGLVVHIVIALIYPGNAFDMESYRIVFRELSDKGLAVYTELAEPRGHRWPYPPGFFPWITIVGLAVGAYSSAFPVLIKLPFIAANLFIAVVVVRFLARRGATASKQLFAAALVCLGPMFILVSGFHGQIDALAIAPAVLAVHIWRHSDHPSRGIAAGLLIGLGAVVKTVPIVMLVALLPSSRSRREALETTLAAGAVPALALLPFAARTPGAVVKALTYAGIPGLGGLSLVVQPGIAGWWMGLHTKLSGFGLVLWRLRAPILIAIAAMVLAVCLKRKPPVEHAAVLLWLAVYVFVPNFALSYLLWGLPFFIIAGYLRAVAVAQIALLVPATLLYATQLYGTTNLHAYVALMITAWVASAVAFVYQLRLIWTNDRRLAAA